MSNTRNYEKKQMFELVDNEESLGFKVIACKEVKQESKNSTSEPITKCSRFDFNIDRVKGFMNLRKINNDLDSINENVFSKNLKKLNSNKEIQFNPTANNNGSYNLHEKLDQSIKLNNNIINYKSNVCELNYNDKLRMNIIPNCVSIKCNLNKESGNFKCSFKGNSVEHSKEITVKSEI